MSLSMKRKCMYYQVWKSLPVIPAFRKLRQEDHEFKSSLSYIGRYCLKGWEREHGGAGL